jgi:hypothetical protein
VQLIAVLLADVVMVAVRPIWGTMVCLAGALLLGVPASYVAFSRGGYWVDFLLPVAVTSLLGVGADVLARRRLRDALGRYVSPEVAARVERNPAALAGERRQVPILFLLTALAGDPDEPTLHLLLGQVYDTIGLGELAQRGFMEARDFSGRR